MQATTDPFYEYPRSACQVSAGTVELPILYYDTSEMMALFWVDHARARGVVDDPGLDVQRFGNGKALVGLAFFEYRETSVGSYNEVGTAIAVVPRGRPGPRWPLLSMYRHVDRRHLGMHIVDLPVTTPLACAAGREIWGYPKFVTEIDFALDGRDFNGTVHDPHGGDSVVRLAGRAGWGLPAPPMDLVLYSRTAAQGLLRTVVNVRGRMQAGLGGSLRVELGRDCRHVMAQRLRELGLDGARPAFAQRTHAFQSRLNAGATIAAAAPARAAESPSALAA